jgi:hypothetical protein
MNNARITTSNRPTGGSTSRLRLANWLLGLLLLFSVGCSPLMSSHQPGKWMWWKRRDEPRVPTKLTPMWTDTVLYQSGFAPVRGFGGRVMFFDGKSDTPVQVDGALTVYAFDGTSVDSTGSVPERKFVFPAEDLEKHFSESKLGPSYSFWLPWDEVGGYERQVTLITRFEPKSGGPTMSQPSRHYLPGLPAPERTELVEQSRSDKASSSLTRHQEHPVQAASFMDVPIDPTVYPRMGTVTIDVPPSFIRHTHGDPLEPLRERMGGVERVGSKRVERSAPRPWWEEQAGQDEEPLRKPEAAEEGEKASSKGPSSSNGAGGAGRPHGGVRREQVRRRPHQANWIPPLPPTPRSEWARTPPDRWPDAPSP